MKMTPLLRHVAEQLVKSILFHLVLGRRKKGDGQPPVSGWRWTIHPYQVEDLLRSQGYMWAVFIFMVCSVPSYFLRTLHHVLCFLIWSRHFQIFFNRGFTRMLGLLASTFCSSDTYYGDQEVWICIILLSSLFTKYKLNVSISKWFHKESCGL